MNNLFTPTDYDFIIGKTIKEEYLNNEDLYIDMEIEDLEQSRDQLINQINNFMIWYYLTCDAIKTKEGKIYEKHKTKRDTREYN